MELKNQIVVVTGGAEGIGRALAVAAQRAGARQVIVADRNLEGIRRTADSIGGIAIGCDVSNEAEVAALVDRTENEIGPIGLFCSNAGIHEMDPDPLNAASGSNESWARCWAVNVMAHVYAARALLPRYIARKGGYFLHTVSAAGLLSSVGSATYSTTKHAAVGFAEYLAITHRDHGVKVSILCPQGVDTAMLKAAGAGPQNSDGVLSPEAVAEIALKSVAEERFLILPHPQVASYASSKNADYDRWLKGMTKLRRGFAAARSGDKGQA